MVVMVAVMVVAMNGGNGYGNGGGCNGGGGNGSGDGGNNGGGGNGCGGNGNNGGGNDGNDDNDKKICTYPGVIMLPWLSSCNSNTLENWTSYKKEKDRWQVALDGISSCGQMATSNSSKLYRWRYTLVHKV